MRLRRLPFRMVLGQWHSGHGGPCFVFRGMRVLVDAVADGRVVEVDMGVEISAGSWVAWDVRSRYSVYRVLELWSTLWGSRSRVLRGCSAAEFEASGLEFFVRIGTRILQYGVQNCAEWCGVLGLGSGEDLPFGEGESGTRKAR